MKIEGSVWKYNDNVDTDVIIPARYLNISDIEELKTHCMEDIDANFSSEVKKGDIIVAGKNFGCGSSREQAPLAIKACGISCIIAESFARIFFRNAVNIGLPVLTIEDTKNIKQGDRLSINLETGHISNISQGTDFYATEMPEFLKGIYAANGLINYIKSG